MEEVVSDTSSLGAIEVLHVGSTLIKAGSVIRQPKLYKPVFNTAE